MTNRVPTTVLWYSRITEFAMRALCKRQQNGDSLVEINLDELLEDFNRYWTNFRYGKEYFLRDLNRFQNTNNYITISDQTISLTQKGRENCTY